MPPAHSSRRIPPQLLAEVRPHFLALKKLPASQQEAALARTCRNARAREAVARLLRHDQPPRPGAPAWALDSPLDDPTRARPGSPTDSGAGGQPAPAPDLKPGDHVDRYVLRTRCAGGIGDIWRAQDTSGRPVAIKMLRPAAIYQFGRVVADRFEREIQIAQAVGGHRSLCRFLSRGEIGGSPFLVMEWIEGESLEQRLQRFRSRPHQRRLLSLDLQFLEEVAMATHRLHQLGYIHRDLKPGNIMIRSCQSPSLIDFGLALHLDATSRLTGMREVLGTPAYMAPEQRVGAYLPCRQTDVYALGALLYEVLTLDTPERIQALGAPNASAPALRNLNPAVSRQLEVVCCRALAPDPADRFRSANAFAMALRAQRRALFVPLTTNIFAAPDSKP